MTRYNLPDKGSQEWYSSPLYPAVADIDRRIGVGTDTSSSLAAQIAALQTAVAAAQASADAANAVKPYWHGYLAANVSLGNDTNTLVAPWTQDVVSGDYFYSAGVLTLPNLTGRYRVTAQLFFDKSSNVGGRLTHVYPGSSGGNPLVTGGTSGNAAGGLDNRQGQSALAIKTLPLSGGSQIRVIGYQGSGGSLNIIGSANKNLSYWQVEYVGPN